MTRRRRILRALASMVVLALVAVPAGSIAAPNGPTAGQRIDLRVLLIAPSATDGVALAWQDTLTRFGVPFDMYVSGQSAALGDASLADYAGGRARYESVILASSAVPLSAVERAALDKLEVTFGVREISDNTTPDLAHGATPVRGAVTTATPTEAGTLTAAGLAVFPYLKGPVPLGGPSFAASGTPGANFTSLVNAADGSSYLGVFTRPNGTEQLVDGIPGNGQQVHFQLLRAGLLNWVTRGAYLGYWRNYFELQVDDLFLADDAWSPTLHANDYNPAVASRMTANDLAKALSWSQANSFRLDFAFNAGGHDQFIAGGAADTLWNAFSAPTPAAAAFRSGFGFINHTYDHPFLGCSSANFITWEIAQNVTAAGTLGLPLNATELVTGEHSGLANTRPGNPGELDPPDFDSLDATTTAGATLGVGSHFYAVTVSNSHGQTPSPTPVAVPVVAGENSVTATISMVCKGTTYSLYRGTTATGPWTLAAQTTQNGDTPTDNGAAVNPVETAVTLVDRGGTVASPAPNTAAAPPAVNSALMDPYAMNPNFTTGLASAGVALTATDSSKTYPVESNPTVPAAVAATQYPAGAAFPLPAPGGKVINTVPRYPTNVFYNASKQGQELDEYNWIYNAAKGCKPIANVTTCNTADVTWLQYLAQERSIVFGHITGNDPRPHFAHQSNLADYNAGLPETDTNQGGILYPYLGNILSYYRGLYADNAPILQLTSTDISAALLRQQTWAANVASGAVSGYLQDNQLHVVTNAAVLVPVTGTGVGDPYAGTTSSWQTFNPGDTPVALKTPIVVPAVSAQQRGKQGVRPALSKLKLSAKKFGAARKGLALKRSRTKITWKLNRVATVKLAIQRKILHKHKKATWRGLGTITKKNARQGTTQVTFTGKLGKRKLGKGSYRIVATATAGGQTSVKKTLTFTIVRL